MDTKDILKDLRSKNGYTFKQIADGSGVSLSTLKKYEIENRELGAKSAVKLARFYNVSTDYLLGLTDDPTPANATINDNSSGDNSSGKTNTLIIGSSVTHNSDDEELLKMIKSLSLLNRSKVIVMIDEMRKGDT